MRISAIVLAAGQSTRIGMNKLLLEVGGRTVIERVVDGLLASNVDQIIVVVGYEGERVQRRLRKKDILVIQNRQYHEGMAASIREGLKHVEEGADGVLIVLADQPLIRSELINRLIDTYGETRKGIVCPAYKGKRGHPVLFNLKKYGEALSRLRGDIGGKTVLEAHRDDVLDLPVDTPGVVRDIDRWEDYQETKRLIAEEPSRDNG